MSASATTVTVGGTTTVTATATYSDDTTAAVTPAWTSSGAAVATVSADGTVTAVAAGTATITGTFGGHSGSADITVTTATTATGTLSGVVDTTGTGVAVAGATVAIVSGANNGRETESDDTGGYEFDALVPDLFEVRVTAAHFEATTFTVNLTDEVRRDVSLTLETPWTVAGTVTDSSQDVPAANVLVEGFFTDVGGPGADRYQPVGQTTTDASGYYSLSGFPWRPATIRFAAGDSRFAEQEFDVQMMDQDLLQTNIDLGPQSTVTSLAVSASASSVSVGSTATVTATATYGDGTTSEVTPTWTSSAENVATVSASGTVTGVATGTATITGTFGGQSDSVDVTVSAPEVTSISIQSDAIMKNEHMASAEILSNVVDRPAA